MNTPTYSSTPTIQTEIDVHIPSLFRDLCESYSYQGILPLKGQIIDPKEMSGTKYNEFYSRTIKILSENELKEWEEKLGSPLDPITLSPLEEKHLGESEGYLLDHYPLIVIERTWLGNNYSCYLKCDFQEYHTLPQQNYNQIPYIPESSIIMSINILQLGIKNFSIDWNFQLLPVPEDRICLSYFSSEEQEEKFEQTSIKSFFADNSILSKIKKEYHDKSLYLFFDLFPLIIEEIKHSGNCNYYTLECRIDDEAFV